MEEHRTISVNMKNDLAKKCFNMVSDIKHVFSIVQTLKLHGFVCYCPSIQSNSCKNSLFLPVFQDAKFENFIKQNWQNEQVTIENEVANVSLVGYHLDDEAIL